MKAYSVDLRSKIVAAYLEQKLSIRKTAEIFACSKSLVQKRKDSGQKKLQWQKRVK